MSKLFFDSWESIVRTTMITILAYIALIIFLRISGKRTLSKMNAFDLVVTIALGSTLATVMLNKDVALADGVLAFFLLVYLQVGAVVLETDGKLTVIGRISEADNSALPGVKGPDMPEATATQSKMQ